MAKTLERCLTTGKQEWQAFIEGRALSTSLLIQLLSYKYRRQKSVFVSTQAVIVNEGEQPHLPEPLSARSLVEYELTVLLYQVGEVYTQALLIRQHAFPFHVFVTKELQQEETDQLRYASVDSSLMGSNGYFVFIFLDRFFTQQEAAFSLDTKEQATLIVEELEKPSLVRQNLATLYRELNTLLADRLATDETRRHVETKKQHFFQLVEDALDLSSKTIPTMAEEATTFLRLPVLLKEEVEEEVVAHSDALFKELQQLLQFVLLVVKTVYRVVVGLDGVEYGPEEVSRRAQRLTNRILTHVDALNVQQHIDASMQASLGFGQLDYERLVGGEQFITYAIVAHTMGATLHPKIMLLGPQQEEKVTPLESQPLILWVTEYESHTQQQLPYYSLAVVSRLAGEDPPVYQEATYTGSNKTSEASEVRNRVQGMLLSRAGIKRFRREIISAGDTTSEYHFTTWYVALLIKRLSDASSVVEGEEVDWVTRAGVILRGITEAQLFANFKRITVTVQRSILALLYPDIDSRVNKVVSQLLALRKHYNALKKKEKSFMLSYGNLIFNTLLAGLVENEEKRRALLFALVDALTIGDASVESAVKKVLSDAAQKS